MSTIGELDRWALLFPDTLIPRVIHLLLDSWKEFKTDNVLEVPITQAFFVVLERNQEFSKLPFLVDLEVLLPNEDGTEQQGRLDLRIIHGFRRKVYFSIECKLLRVERPSGRFESLADKYVTEGMYRYFNGQYASGLDKGGMLGYVMDGQVKKAIGDVTNAIHAQRKKLYMDDQQTLRPSHVMPSDQIKETEHNYGPQGTFVVYHIFLPYRN